MSRQQTDSARASGVIVRNVAVIGGILVLMISLIIGARACLMPEGGGRVPPLLSRGPGGQQWTMIGTPPVVYDRGLADKLLYTERAGPVERIEVLDSGLIAGRGLAALKSDSDRADPSCPEDLLIVADAWEGLYEYRVPGRNAQPWCTTIRKPRKLPDIEVCPSAVCDDVDHRGVALIPASVPPRIVVADAHQRRLSVRDMNGDFVAAMGGPRLFTGVTALAAKGNGLFYVTTVPSDAERALDWDDPQRTGARLWQVVDGDDAQSRAIGRGLERPVGVAYSQCWDRVYVADATEQQTVWFYYEGDRVRAATHEQAGEEGLLEPSGVLSTEAADRAPTPPVLQGIAVGRCEIKQATPTTGSRVERSGGEVFAAGPGGLYVFRPNGTLIARYVLSERIAGLAWGDDNVLYMTIGHRVARLITKMGGEQLKASR